MAGDLPRNFDQLILHSLDLGLAFQLPGSFKYIEAVGEVKHIRERGMGVEFVAMDAESKEETERFVGDYLKYQDQPSKR